MIAVPAWLNKWRAPELWAGAIILAGILIRLPLLAVPITWSSDIWRQTDTAAIARHFLRNGFQLFYPQIYWGGAGPGYVETEFQLYTFLVAVFYKLAGEQVWLGRLVALLFTIPAIVCFWQLSQRLLPRRPALVALACLCVIPVYVRYSLAFMPEATVMCFYLLALYLFQRWLAENKTRWLLWAAASTALAILVKPTAIHIGIIFAVLAVWRYGWRVLLQPRVWVALLVVLVPVVAYYLHASHLYQQYGNTFGVLSGGDDKFGTVALRLTRYWYIVVGNNLQTLIVGLPGIPVFVLGVVAAFHHRQSHKQSMTAVWLVCGVATMLIYLFIVARYALIAPNYYVYFAPYAAWGLALGIEWLWVHRRWAGIGATALTIDWLTMTGAGQMLFESRNLGETPLEACGKLVNRSTPAQALISVTTAEEAMHADGMQNNYQEPTLFFFADRHGLVLPPEGRRPKSIEAHRNAGMQYLVVHDPQFLVGFPDVAEYLRTHAERATAQAGAACDIYRFKLNTK